jgi:hypothetical protein
MQPLSELVKELRDDYSLAQPPFEQTIAIMVSDLNRILDALDMARDALGYYTTASRAWISSPMPCNVTIAEMDTGGIARQALAKM